MISKEIAHEILVEFEKIQDQLDEFSKKEFLLFVRRIAVEEYRKRKVVESTAKLKGAFGTPIGFQKALEKAMEAKAEIWKDFREASKFDLLLCEERQEKRLELAKELRTVRKSLDRLRSEERKRLLLYSRECESRSMPKIPEPKLTRKELALMNDKFAGVYIAFEFGLVQYVGESCNIPQRMRAHEKVKENWLVSVIKTEPHERFFAECFYIWLLKPPLNKEGGKTVMESKRRMKEEMPF